MKNTTGKIRIAVVILIAILAVSTHPAVAASSTRVSEDSGGVQADSYSKYSDISADGHFVAFVSWAANLVPGDTNHCEDVFVRDLQSGLVTRASVSSDGEQANNSADNYKPSISANGRYVTFASRATNLVVGDTNSSMDIFVRDTLNGTTGRASVNSSGLQANGDSMAPSISADGRYIVFESYANNLVNGDTGFIKDIFVHDMVTGATTRASVSSSGAGGNGDSFHSDISNDGRYTSYTSQATNLVPGDNNAAEDIFLHDNVNGTTTRLSVSTGGTQANNISQRSVISSDGRYVAFSSYATNLIGGDTNGSSDIFVRDTVNGTTTRVSLGAGGVQANSNSYFPSISPDCRYVAFFSHATNLVPGDTNGFQDIFVRDTVGGATTRVSVDSAGTQANNFSIDPSISGDGRYISFTSDATNLVNDDTNGVTDIFVNDYSPVAVVIDPAGWDFGDQAVGTSSGPHTFTLQNTSPTDVVIGVLGMNGDFSLSANSCTGQTLAPGGTCSFGAIFTPVFSGLRTGSVFVPVDDRPWSEIVILRGTGTNAAPAVDILSIFSNQGNLFSQIDIADPEDDPLSGAVKIVLYPNLPISVSFETLSCNAIEPAELRLNGVLVGTNPGAVECSCNPGISASVFTGPEITNSYLLGEDNTWAYSQSDLAYSSATAWARAIILFSNGVIQNACMFDATGTGCTTTDLCTGYVWGPISDSSVQPTAEEVLASASYNNSILPLYLDTSGIYPGPYTLLATTRDEYHLPARDLMPFTANNEPRLYINTTNLPPVLDTIGDRIVDELTTLVISATATDPLSDTLSFSLDPGAPAGAVIDPITGVFSWTPSEVQGPGTYTTTVRVTDDGVPSMDDHVTFTTTVNEVNTAPLLSPIGDQNINELMTLIFTATASDVDVPANYLTFFLEAGAPVGAVIDPSTGVFNWTPTEADGPGVYTITVSVADNGVPSMSDSEVVCITVNEVNQAPVANAGNDQAVDAGDFVQLNGSASYDPDGQPLLYRWVQTGGSPQLSLSDPSTVAPTFTVDNSGVYTFTLTVTDTFGMADSDAVAITAMAFPATDLAISLSRSGLTTIIYTVTVSNLGSNAADGALVQDNLPPIFYDVTWTCNASNGAACSNANGSGNLLAETIATLPAGGKVTFVISAKINVFGDDSNQVTVTAPASVTDLDTGNNIARVERSYRVVLPFALVLIQ